LPVITTPSIWSICMTPVRDVSGTWRPATELVLSTMWSPCRSQRGIPANTAIPLPPVTRLCSSQMSETFGPAPPSASTKFP